MELDCCHCIVMGPKVSMEGMLVIFLSRIPATHHSIHTTAIYMGLGAMEGQASHRPMVAAENSQTLPPSEFFDSGWGDRAQRDAPQPHCGVARGGGGTLNSKRVIPIPVFEDNTAHSGHLNGIDRVAMANELSKALPSSEAPDETSLPQARGRGGTSKPGEARSAGTLPPPYPSMR